MNNDLLDSSKNVHAMLDLALEALEDGRHSEAELHIRQGMIKLGTAVHLAEEAAKAHRDWQAQFRALGAQRRQMMKGNQSA